jgi:prepilin-type N-terminal cleavage/methylation domain-containing protein
MNSRPPARWRRGFTIVEVVTVTIVLLILAAIGIPWMSPVVRQFRLKGAAWQLVGDLRLARQRAVTIQKRFRICVSGCAISVPPDTYSVEVDEGPLGSPSWTSETGTTVRLPPDVSLTATDSATFVPTGTASGSTFTLSNPIGSYQVKVASTGQVTACPTSCP